MEDKKFMETMLDKARFASYSIAIEALIKSLEILISYGANRKAVSFISVGIELLLQQIHDTADTLERKAIVINFLKNIRKGDKK